MSFNQAVKAFGAAYDAVTAKGERELGFTPSGVYLSLLRIAAKAHEAGADITKTGEWHDAYLAVLAASGAIRKAAYLLGLAMTPAGERPLSVGPSIVIG